MIVIMIVIISVKMHIEIIDSYYWKGWRVKGAESIESNDIMRHSPGFKGKEN